MTPAPPARPVASRKNPLVAALLSLVLPGLGFVYAGAIGPAAAFFGLSLGGPLVVLGLVIAGASTDQLSWVSMGNWAIGVRTLAAVASAIWVVRRPMAKPLPMGAYAIFVLANLLLSQGVAALVAPRIPVFSLAAGAPGYEQGARVLAKRFGDYAQPAAHRSAVYFIDEAEAKRALLVPTMRPGYIGTVESVSEQTFRIEGLDASVPLADYGGVPVGALPSMQAPGCGGTPRTP